MVYLIKLSIGLFHYLYFIDPLYFQGSGNDVTLHFEFQAVFSQIITFANDRKLENGLLYYNFNLGGVTHQEILSFISIPFMYFGDYIMTFAPLNSFFSILISINIILIAKHIYKIYNKSLKYIAITSAYFPMTLISSLIYRYNWYSTNVNWSCFDIFLKKIHYPASHACYSLLFVLFTKNDLLL